MKPRLGRLIACLVVVVVTSTALPQVAYAAPADDSDEKGIIDTVKGWFSDDGDDSGGLDNPPSRDELGVADREKVSWPKVDPKVKRVRELTGKRTANARFWQLSDGRIEAELSAVPTSYRSGSGKKASWKSVDTTVRASQAKGFEFANTTNEGRSWFGGEADGLVRFQSPDGRSVTLGLDGVDKGLKPKAKACTVTYDNAVEGADLQYVVGPGRVKENITLAERPNGPVQFTFTLNTDGLIPKARKDGSIALYGELPHTPVMVIPAPCQGRPPPPSTRSPTKAPEAAGLDPVLIAWGVSCAADILCWDASAEDPATWPLLVYNRGDNLWRRYDCGVVEFLVRVIRAEFDDCPLGDESFWGAGSALFLNEAEERRRIEQGLDPWTGGPDPFAGMFGD